MSHRAIVLQLRKTAVVASRPGTVLERLPRASVPARQTDRAQLALGTPQHREFGCSNHLQPRASPAGTGLTVFILQRHIYCKDHQRTSHLRSLTLSDFCHFFRKFILQYITAQAERLDSLHSPFA